MDSRDNVPWWMKTGRYFDREGWFLRNQRLKSDIVHVEDSRTSSMTLSIHPTTQNPSPG